MNVKQWGEIVSYLARKHPDLIKIRSTDHEYREDDTDIIEWRGRKVCVSVDSLPFNNAIDTKMKQEMIECYKNSTEH